MVLGTDPALALTGRHATPGVLTFHGFRFSYLNLEEALGDLLG
jgi:NAD dependent epimerase/dehydratase family enzyme